VLLRNEEVFRRWRRLGLNYMFLGLGALDEESLKALRKRTTPKVNSKACFGFVREWAMSVP
jgi:hypothetical protein